MYTLHTIIVTSLQEYLPFYLNLFSLFSILFFILVIINKNPVVSILFLICSFISISAYLMSLGLNIIGLSYLLVYIGAVSILFLFILMLINIWVSKGLTKKTSLPISGNTSDSIILCTSEITITTFIGLLLWISLTNPSLGETISSAVSTVTSFVTGLFLSPTITPGQGQVMIEAAQEVVLTQSGGLVPQNIDSASALQGLAHDISSLTYRGFVQQVAENILRSLLNMLYYIAEDNASYGADTIASGSAFSLDHGVVVHYSSYQGGHNAEVAKTMSIQYYWVGPVLFAFFPMLYFFEFVIVNAVWNKPMWLRPRITVTPFEISIAIFSTIGMSFMVQCLDLVTIKHLTCLFVLLSIICYSVYALSTANTRSQTSNPRLARDLLLFLCVNSGQAIAAIITDFVNCM